MYTVKLFVFYSDFQYHFPIIDFVSTKAESIQLNIVLIFPYLNWKIVRFLIKTKFASYVINVKEKKTQDKLNYK